MIDEFVDRLKGRRIVANGAACVQTNDVFFDALGVKWLCVNTGQEGKAFAIDLDEIEPFSKKDFAKGVMGWFFGITFTLGSIALPIYWYFWRNS